MDCDLYISVPSFLYTYDANKCKSFVSRCIFEFLKTILGQRPPQIQSLPGNTVLSRDSPILFDVGENGLPNMSIVLPTHLVGESRSTPRRAILYNYAKICCLWPIPEEVAALMRQKVDVLRSMLISLEMSPPGSDEQSHDMLSAFILPVGVCSHGGIEFQLSTQIATLQKTVNKLLNAVNGLQQRMDGVERRLDFVEVEQRNSKRR